MSETTINLAQYGVVNTRPAHTLAPGEMVAASGWRYRQGDPYNIWTDTSWSRFAASPLNAPYSIRRDRSFHAVLTFDGAGAFHMASVNGGPLASFGPGIPPYTYDTPDGGVRGTFTKFGEIYLYHNGSYEALVFDEEFSPTDLLPTARPEEVIADNQFYLAEEGEAGWPNLIPIGGTYTNYRFRARVDDRGQGSRDFRDDPADDDSRPRILYPDFGAVPAVSSTHRGRFTYWRITGSTPVAEGFEGEEVYIYWFRLYCKDYDILMPNRWGPTQDACVVRYDSGVAREWLDLNVEELSTDLFEMPTDTAGNVRFNRIRIYRHRCRDLEEAGQILYGNSPLTGGLVGELEFDNATGTGFTSGKVFRDTATTKFDGTVAYPLVRIDEGGQTLIYDRVRAKEPYTVAASFQGSLVTNAPRLADDVLVYSPPNEPWYNPAPYFIQLSSTDQSVLQGMVEINGFLVVLYDDRILRLNYLPFGARTGQPVWEYVAPNRGCITREAFTTFHSERGSFVAFVSDDGLWATDGRAVFRLTQNWALTQRWALEGSVSLTDDWQNSRLLLHRDIDAAGEQSVEEWAFYYDSLHTTENGLKVLGPTYISRETPMGPVIGVKPFTDRDPLQATSTGYLRKLVIAARNTETGSLELFHRDGAVPSECALTTGDLHPRNPKMGTRIRRMGFYHTEAAGTELEYRFTKKDQGAAPFTTDWFGQPLEDRGFSDLARAFYSGRRMAIEFRYRGPSLVGLGPIQLTDDRHGGKNV